MKKRWIRGAVVGALLGGLTAGVVGTTSVPAGAAEEPTPTFTPMYWIGDTAMEEGDAGTRFAKVPITLSAPLSSPALFVFRTVDHGEKGADVGVDHPRVNRRVTVPAGKTSKVLSLPILGDMEDEGDEPVFYELVPLDTAPLAAAKSEGSARILDDDEPSDVPNATLSIASTRVFEGATGWQNQRVAITLSRPQASDVRVTWRTVASSATPGEDFGAVHARTTTIRAGRTQASALVKVFGDTPIEGDEIFDLDVTGAAGRDGLPFIAHDGFMMIADDDTDTDGDGLPDAAAEAIKSEPEVADSDGDGLSDGEEVRQFFTNPNQRDTDGDGVSDSEEIVRFGTDPRRVDTDGDGFDDLLELKASTDPLDATSHP